MVIMRPTSIVVAGAGSSASIRAAGGVEFDTAETLSLNGVFTSEFDDYMIVIRYVGTNNNNSGLVRMRVSGTDNTTASSYTDQYIAASSTSVSASRGSQTSAILFNAGADQRSGASIYFYGPYLAQPTAIRSVTVGGAANAYLIDCAVTHNQSTAYDGFTLFPNNNGTFTGQLTVYGLSQ